MSGLLICAAWALLLCSGAVLFGTGCILIGDGHRRGRRRIPLGLALIAAALYLAWRAGGAGA